MSPKKSTTSGLKMPVRTFSSRFDIPSYVAFELVQWHDEVSRQIEREAALVDQYPWTQHEQEIHNYAHHMLLNLVERVKQSMKRKA